MVRFWPKAAFCSLTDSPSGAREKYGHTNKVLGKWGADNVKRNRFENSNESYQNAWLGGVMLPAGARVAEQDSQFSGTRFSSGRWVIWEDDGIAKPQIYSAQLHAQKWAQQKTIIDRCSA
jgi:hypothetical protein